MNDFEPDNSEFEPSRSGSSDNYVPPNHDFQEQSSASSDELSYEDVDEGMNESNINNPGPSTSVTTCKKRKSVNHSEWKRNITKESIATGKSYINYNGQEIGERKTGPDCCCKKYKCFLQINEEKRNIILKGFNSLGDANMQNVYLGGLIKTGNVERQRSNTGAGKK